MLTSHLSAYHGLCIFDRVQGTSLRKNDVPFSRRRRDFPWHENDNHGQLLSPLQNRRKVDVQYICVVTIELEFHTDWNSTIDFVDFFKLLVLKTHFHHLHFCLDLNCIFYVLPCNRCCTIGGIILLAH
jgi:hypothetical protein